MKARPLSLGQTPGRQEFSVRLPDETRSADAALVLLSAGQDSAVCLAWALDRYRRVQTVGFGYRQPHLAELKARRVVRRKMARLAPVWGERLGPDHRLNLRAFGAIGDSAMT